MVDVRRVFVFVAVIVFVLGVSVLAASEDLVLDSKLNQVPAINDVDGSEIYPLSESEPIAAPGDANGLFFNGEPSALDTDVFVTKKSWSVVADAKSLATGITQGVIGQSVEGSMDMWISDESKLVCKTKAGSEDILCSSNTILESEEFSHLGCVFDAQTQRTSVYVDGGWEQNCLWDGELSVQDGGVFLIGDTDSLSAEPFLGVIKNVKIYDAALSESEMLLLSGVNPLTLQEGGDYDLDGQVNSEDLNAIKADLAGFWNSVGGTIEGLHDFMNNMAQDYGK